MDCSAIIPAGSARKACLLDQPTNLIIMELGTTFTNYLAAENSENWRTAIQENRTIYPTLDIRNVTPTKPATQKESGGDNSEVTTRLSPGGAVVNLKTNACDFKEMIQTMNGGYYSFVIGLGADKVMVLEDEDGVIGGFTGQATAIPVGYPGKDAKLEEFQLDINWDNIEEWGRYRILELPIFLKELVEYAPLGLDFQVNTPLSASDMTLKVSQKCRGALETDTLTAEIVKTNITDTPAVTVAAGTNDGDYTITLEKGAVPTDLVAGDYINYRLVKKTTNVYDKISGIIKGRLW